jgi:hypothetical protein
MLNGNGDLSMLDEVKPYIGKPVEWVKVCKSGLIQIRAEDGTLLSVPKRNLDVLRDQPAGAPSGDDLVSR